MIAGTSQRLPQWVPRLALAVGALLAALGVLTGLTRMGWNIPLPHRARLTVEHGPLLVGGRLFCHADRLRAGRRGGPTLHAPWASGGSRKYGWSRARCAATGRR